MLKLCAMRSKIRVYKGGQARLPKEVAQDFVGENDLLRNFLTATIVKRGASPADVIHSLSLIIEDLYLQQGQRVEVRIEKVD